MAPGPGRQGGAGGGGDARHEPVLLKEVIDLVTPARSDGWIVDATTGLGGHSAALLERWPEAKLLGIDRDPRALEIASERLASYGERVELVEGRHESLIEILDMRGIDRVDALLADLGVSSLQLDDADRGFSFRRDAPLDMRMGSDGETAAELLERIDEADLVRILRDWGEEPLARPIARAIMAEQAREAIVTTGRLADIIRSVKKPGRSRIDPATLTFQALRIAVNGELVALDGFVRDAVGRLASGGRCGVISFHSLEDRIVKQTFRELQGVCRCPPAMPVCGCGMIEVGSIVTRKAVEAGPDEVDRNPRARSARLRVFEKR